MRELKLILRSVAAALLVIVLGAAGIVGIVWGFLMLRDAEVLMQLSVVHFAILMVSMMFLGTLAFVSASFYAAFSRDSPEVKSKKS